MPWVESYAGDWCKHCDIAKGCKIWGEHPKECKEYYCMWVQQEKSSENMRPDRCGVIFDKIADDIILAKVDPDRKRLADDIKRQIKLFTNEGFSVVMVNQKIGKPIIYGGKGKDEKEIWDEIIKIREEWLHTLQTLTR
jgi:hypothetical protein